MKKVPYGIIDYRKLILEGYEYVDKTMYLEKLEDVASTVICLRPGRFGKSLFTSMMYYYYDINSSDLFDTLFKDMYVGKNPTKGKNNYYILSLDFSGISTDNKSDEELKQSFKGRLIDGIEKFENSYGYKFEEDISLISPDDALLKFLSWFRSLDLEHKLYIMIDEYDNFTNAILEGDAKKFLGTVGNAGFMKSFFANIKLYIKEGVIDRFFATGICPVTLDSMTTGFNIATDISQDLRFNEMIGLTHAEVLKLLDERDDKEKLFDIMIKNYDGYKFSKNSEIRIFNATLVMWFLEKLVSFGSVPDELFDKNIVVNYGKIDNLLKLQGNDIYQEIIDELLKTDKITGMLKTSFNLLEDFMRDHIISLLYYFGYLTIKEYNIITNRMVFEIPNRIMLETYNNYFIKLLKDINVSIEGDYQEEYEEILYEGKIDGITKIVSEVLKKIDNRMFMKFDEKYIQLLYFTLLINNRLISIYSEYPCKNGYIDLMLLKSSEYSKYNIMIELKYIKKSEYSDEILNEKVNEGEEQLRKYELDERIDKDNLKKYLVVFVGNEAQVLKEV